MKNFLRRAFGSVSLLACAAAAQPLASSVAPALPTAADTVWVVVTGSIGGADTIADSGVTVSGATVNAYVSIRPCLGACPRSIKMLAMRLRAGRLAAGTYDLVTTVNDVDRSQVPPDTTRTVTTREFTVYPVSSSPHRLIAVYQSDHGMTAPDTASYYFTNGDTLSVTAVFTDQCCARYGAAIHSTGDGNGDTLTVLLTDTTMLMCNCVGTQYVTAAVDNVTSSRLWVRMLYANAWSTAPQLLYAFAADAAAPAVCVNVADVNSPGFKLFVDSTWFEYEMPTAVVKRAAVLRLQPNPGFDARTNNSVFVDNVSLDTAAAGLWSGHTDTLVDFETYYEGQWQIMALRDGSALATYWLLATGGHLMEMEYSNALTGSVSNYVWRSLSPQRTIHGACRIMLKASCAKPEGATGAAARRSVVRAPGQSGEFRIAAGTLNLFARVGGAHDGLRVELLDLGGRILGAAAVPGPGREIALRGPRPGAYLLRVRSGNGDVSCAKIAVDE